MSPLRRVALVLVVVLAGGAGTAACGDDGGGGATGAGAKRAAQVRAAAAAAGLPDDVADLLADAASVVDERFRVTYDLGGEAGGTAVLTQDPPRRRVDLRVEVDGREVTRSSFTDGESSTVCERAGGTWTCRNDPSGEAAAAGAFGSDQIDAVVDDLRESRDTYVFRVGRRKVVGVDGRCLVTELKPGREPTEELGAKGTLCISPEGVPLLVETPVASLRALRYSDSVDDDMFDLPADVSTS